MFSIYQKFALDQNRFAHKPGAQVQPFIKLAVWIILTKKYKGAKSRSTYLNNRLGVAEAVLQTTL